MARKEFAELSIKAQKKRIVKDAIAQITMKRIKAVEGIYMDFHDKLKILSPGELPIKNLRKLLKSDILQCDVCAKGALFAACVINVNKVSTADDFGKEYFQSNKLSKWFSKGELDTIECAYEGSPIYDSSNILYSDRCFNYSDLTHRCIKFYNKYKTAKGRMLAILNNILKNGEFKP